MCASVCVYVRVNLCAIQSFRFPERPEEGTRFLRARVMGGCETPHWVVETEPGSSASMCS